MKTDWQKLQARALAKYLADGVSFSALARQWGLDSKQSAERLLKGSSEPRYSLGKVIERWVEENNSCN